MPDCFELQEKESSEFGQIGHFHSAHARWNIILLNWDFFHLH